MIGVIDTSALIRVFVPDGPMPEGLEAFLRGAETGENIAIAPQLMLAEAGNVLHKKRLRGELSDKEALTLLDLVQSMPIRLVGHEELMGGALRLAGQHKLTVYDALFLELARQKGAHLFSADEQLCTLMPSTLTTDN
ncbi:MAG TPA: PIN domain-containing protein [Sedimenticola sp.]|nr:PIN domain-containing protein [Sedimenticola sp.]